MIGADDVNVSNEQTQVKQSDANRGLRNLTLICIITFLKDLSRIL